MIGLNQGMVELWRRSLKAPALLYAGCLMFIGMALALGSTWALIPAVLSSALLALRTAWEDRLLQAELPGYRDFARRVRWRRREPCQQRHSR